MLELYHAEPMANTMKVLLCLKEKQLDFVSHYVNLQLFEQYEPVFLAINPNGQVPALVHNGAVIVESTVINEYLEDAFPENSLRPADPVERARMRIWTKHVDEHLCPALTMIGAHGGRHFARNIPKEKFERLLERIPLKEARDKWATIGGESYSEEQLAESRRKLGVTVDRMEAALADGPWLAGGSFSLADVNVYPMAAGVFRILPDIMNEQRSPRAVDWLHRMDARPGVQAARAMPDKRAETMRSLESAD